MTKNGLHIGIDLGGTKTSGVLMEESGAVRRHIRIASPRGNYDDTVQAIRTLVDDLTDSTAPNCPVGVGIPGAISPATGLVKNANSTWLIGRPIDRDLTAALARPVRVANDADCFALSEALDGAGAGYRSVFGVILGTGVGGGLVFDRRLHEGPNAIAGEWSHNPLPRPDPETDPLRDCYCGRTGCIETFLSGPGLAEDHLMRTGEAATPEEIMAAETPDRENSLTLYADRMARALATVINIVDPEVIVLGGGLSGVTALYDLVPDRLTRHVFSDTVRTRLLPNRHGDDSGVLGAARLWLSTSAVS
ncbi:ROK family protein [Rhodospirillaceae bacterium KN72]|uniref:ROK family protein n=1 Tax=Pacificispira spongiicola TaxID=2729598 RepID=A0A7Y0DZ43_9PROT|nr:ROK family protein [Pacificispira spongiicola]NMM44248.1 ROK family protein [Pacificispira spongiicola]